MPSLAPSDSTASIRLTASIFLPSSEQGTPASKPMVCRSGACGFVNASRVSTQAVSGMQVSETSVSLPPIVVPQRPRFTEYAAPNGGTRSRRDSG